MNFSRKNGALINQNDDVKVTKMQHVIEVQYMDKINRKSHIKKLDADTYVLLETGEIKDFEKSENRGDNVNSLRQTFKRLRYLINNNFSGRANELHVTLTYAENMTDIKRLYDDFKKFVMRLRYRFKSKSTFDYLSVAEPQARGAWHMHVLIRFNDLNHVFIKNSELREMWQKGFVKIKSLKDVDNIGAYLSAYLGDVVLDEHQQAGYSLTDNDKIKQVTIDGETKRVVKGARLKMYPPGMNLYRKSAGIVEPTSEMMKYEDIKKVVGNGTPHYSSTVTIEGDEYQNVIMYEQYNLKREKSE